MRQTSMGKKQSEFEEKKNSQREATKEVEKTPAWEPDSSGLWRSRSAAGLFMNFSQPVFSPLSYHLSSRVVKVKGNS